MNTSWNLNNDRKAQLNKIYKSLGIDSNILPLHYLDASFTAKSIRNEMKNNFVGDDNSFLSVLGSIIIQLQVDIYLKNIFIDNEEDLKYVDMRSSIVNSDNLAKYIDIDWNNIIRQTKSSIHTESELSSIRIDAFKAVIGSLFLYGIREKQIDPFFYISQIIIPICEKTIANPNLSYTTLIQELTQSIDLDVSVEKYTSIGKDHERTYYCELKLSDSKGRIQTVYKIGEGVSKSKARNNASLEMLCHIENLICTSDDFRNTSQDFINNSAFYLNKSTLEYREIP